MSAVKKAATSIKEGYETFLKGHKDLSISHKSTDEGAITVSIKGPVSAIDSAHKAIIADAHQTLMRVQPDRVVIHSAHVETHEGPATEKETDRTKSISIHHIVTTY